MRQAIALALFLLLLGCREPASSRVVVLRIAAAGDLAPFHPLTSSTFTTSATDLVFQRILRVDEAGVIRPGAVRSWERLAADRVRVQVDPDLRFSDGSPVRPEDLVRSMVASGLEVRPAGDWLEIGPGRSPDPLSVTLLYTAVFKEGNRGPLGTGPFRLVEGDARHIVLDRVHPVPGRVARVEVQSVATPRDAFARALRGDVNAVTGLDERQSELMEGVPGLRVVRGAGPHAVAVVMNAARFSPRERQALAASVPVAELVRAYGGNCSALEPQSRHQPAPPGRPLNVASAVHDPGLPRAALALRRSLGTRGGDVSVEQASRAMSRIAAQDFDLFISTVIAWPPAMLGWFARTGARSNWSAYSNPRVDAAVDRGDATTVLEELRRDPPMVLVCRRERIAAVDARIRNPTLGNWGLLDTLPDWEVGP